MLNNSIVSVLGFSIVLLSLSACADTEKTLNVTTSPVERPKLVVPKPDVLKTRQVQWIVVNQENAEQILNSNSVLFGLTETGYKNLSLNLNDLRTFIQQQQIVIAAYEEYYQSTVDELNEIK